MGIASSSSLVRSSSEVYVTFDAFPNSAGATATGADVAFKAAGGSYGTPVPASIGPADPSLGLPAGSVSCSGTFNPAGASGELTVRCRVMWSDNVTDLVEFRVIIIVTPPNGSRIEYSVSDPAIQVGGSSTITATLKAAGGSGVANAQISFTLETGSNATGSLDPVLGLTDAAGSISSVFSGAAITGPGNRGQARIQVAAGSGASDPHHLVIIHVRS